MYFKYLWNNFLHTQVEICTAMILAMPSTQSESPEINRENDQEPIRENILIKHVSFTPIHHKAHVRFTQLILILFAFDSQLFQKCQLIQRILDAWGSNEKEQ